MITQLAVYTAQIPGICCFLWDYIIPTTFYQNQNHQNYVYLHLVDFYAYFLLNCHACGWKNNNIYQNVVLILQRKGGETPLSTLFTGG